LGLDEDAKGNFALFNLCCLVVKVCERNSFTKYSYGETIFKALSFPEKQQLLQSMEQVDTTKNLRYYNRMYVVSFLFTIAKLNI
jgi:hypothetical protein